MNLFDGQFKSKPKINLAGSSSTKSRDVLIREAIEERKKREAEKKQQYSATKIQALFRSYIIRKRLHDEFRLKYKPMFNNYQPHTNHEFKTLLSYFVFFYTSRHDQSELSRLSKFIITHKEQLIRILFEKDSNIEYALCKFLAIHLRLLNQKIKHSEISHSVSLRLIDYFTDPKSYEAVGFSNQQYESKLALILKFLINQGFIKNLIDYGITKIPKGCTNEAQAPLIYSISHLINRIFESFNSRLKTNDNCTDSNEMLVIKLCSEFFVKCQHESQVKTIMYKLSQIISETVLSKDKTNNEQGATIHESRRMENLLKFIEIIRTYVVKNSFNLYKYEDYMSILYCVLTLTVPVVARLSNENFILLINALQSLIIKILTLDLNFETKSLDMDSEDYENHGDQMQVDGNDDDSSENSIQSEVFKLLDSKLFSNRLESTFLVYQKSGDDSGFCFLTSYIFYFMLKISRLNIHESNLLRKVAFNKFYLYKLWKNICTLKTGDPMSKNEIYYLQVLASGNLAKLDQESLYKIVAPLSTFSSLYNLFLLPILDDEFLNGEAIFGKIELIKMGSNLKDVCLGIIQLMHPDTVSAQTSLPMQNEYDLYRNLNMRFLQNKNNASFLKLRKQAACFTHLFQQCAQLVQRLYTKDIRTGFCAVDHWLAKSFKLVSLTRLSDILQTHEPCILTNIKFGQASYLFQQQDEFFMQQENKLNVNDIRSLTILQELPFTVAFNDRIKILETFLTHNDHQRYNLNDPTVRVRIRRDYLYEDAFDNLSLENCPNLKTSRLVVEMINQHGLDEAGIDGGGLLREFLNDLLETSFDPTRGFFILTSDGFLYPNPNVEYLVKNFEPHYFFLGRILGKAIQCKILSSLKFAMFFLQKILIIKSKSMDTRLDIDYLVSLDHEVYKNLLSLKDSERIEDLELNFALDSAEFGETKTTELKPGGTEIFVNDDNKIEYIHLVADYKLNKQINRQVIAFRNGLANVIDLELLRLFNFNEFQYLISGSDEKIDVRDWMNYTVYAGVYSSECSVIINFWKVVESFTDDQRRKLLKFVTSRSRTPLFGFKNLIPNFAIHSSGSEERLPTASTCMNLLKLPPIEDFELLKNKLICAIESDAGFELS